MHGDVSLAGHSVATPTGLTETPVVVVGRHVSVIITEESNGTLVCATSRVAK